MKTNNEKGSALITVILVVLVLTMVGIASLFFMTTEERITNTARLEKIAFYAAEIGLRRAETSIRSQYSVNPNCLTNMLSYNPGVQSEWTVLQVPGCAATTSMHDTAVVFTDPTDLEVQAQRQDPALALIDPDNSAIPPAEMRGFLVDNQGYVSTYNLYLRNDDDESSDTIDGNGIVNAISVGLVVTPTGQVIRKVLEEGIAPVGAGGAGFLFQKGRNMGGTGA